MDRKATQTFFAPCPRGLEGVLRDELEQWGAQVSVATHGGVQFSGPFDLCYKANLESRIASRVLWRVFHGRYRTEQDIYQAAYSLPWRDWFSARHTIKVKVSAQHCPLNSLDFVTLRIKDAVCDRFSAFTRVRPSVDTHKPDIRIDAFLDRSGFTLYLDTSGDALFKRGWRKVSAEAPLRENLAAGILRLSGWSAEHPLLDPMCGGGTIVLEAALMALNVAPGLGRSFAFEKLNNFDQRAWLALCQASRARQAPRVPLAIYGSDLHGAALKAAQSNLEAAGLTGVVKVKQVNVLELKPPAEEGVLIMNPPYGVRTGAQTELAEFYPRLGDRLKHYFAGWRAYIFTADLRLPTLVRLSATRRTPLFNGALECRLFEFKMVQGGMRRSKATANRSDDQLT